MNTSLVDAPAVAPARHRTSRTSVKSGFAWVLAGYVAYMACQWGMLVVLARWGSADAVGRFHLALATTAPIILFCNLGLRRVYATDADGSFRFSDYLGLRLITCGVAVGATAAIALGFGYTGAILGAILAMSVAKAIEAVCDILHGYFQNRRRIDVGARSTLMRGPVSLAGLAIAFLLTRDVVWAISGMAAGWLLVTLFYDGRMARRFLRERPERETTGTKTSLARLSLPLGVVSLMTSLRSHVPTLIVAAHFDVAWVGLFGSVIYFHAASNRVVSALGEAATTPLAGLMASGDRAAALRLIGIQLAASLGISLAGLAVAVVAGQSLLGAFYGPEYASQGGLLIAVMGAVTAANLQTVLDYAMTAAREFRIQPWIYGGGLALLLGACLIFVPAWGLTGAALSLGLVSVAELIASAVIVARAVSRIGREPAARAEAAC